MSLQTTEINNVIITFDKEATQNYKTGFNEPCDCQDCRNFYKNIENNGALKEFLDEFGIDHRYTEEVFSWEKDYLIHSEGYYSVFGGFDEEDFSFEKFGVNISFNRRATVPYDKRTGVPHDRSGEYFWIIVSSDFPYVLEEKRERVVVSLDNSRKNNLFERIKVKFLKK